ncbi:MAG: hypothetical protein MOB07_18300 [Acidobacteria bacterium]|nr:hypothetical protein [Acidobacteriota bacterium]
MASQQDSFSKYPREVRSSTQRPTTVYTLLPDQYAVHRQGSRETLPSEGATTVMSEGETTIEVFRGDANERRQGASPGAVGPVYALQPGGTPAIPTGRVFIRFKEGVAVEERIREIEQAGYEIAQTIEYAPHASWLRARSNEIADALAGIRALEKIADVENVEPQMLMRRASRD